MNQKKIRFIFGFVIVIFLLVLFLSGCKSAELKVLEDSASIIQLQTGLEVSRSLQDKDTVLGKPVYAKIIIIYEPINNYTKEEVYAEIVSILKKNNWEGSEPVIGRDSFKATLQQGGFEISAGVTVDSDRNRVIVIMIIY